MVGFKLSYLETWIINIKLDRQVIDVQVDDRLYRYNILNDTCNMTEIFNLKYWKEFETKRWGKLQDKFQQFG